MPDFHIPGILGLLHLEENVLYTIWEGVSSSLNELPDRSGCVTEATSLLWTNWQYLILQLNTCCLMVHLLNGEHLSSRA